MASNTTQPTPGAAEGARMFDYALRALEDSLKASLKAQEDTLRFWSEAVSKVNPAQGGELIPMAHRHAEEYLRLLETSYRRNAELVKKVMEAQNPSDPAELGQRTNDWLKASMEAARQNAQDLASTNMRVAEAWTEAVKKATQRGV